MAYIERHLTTILKRYASSFPFVLITGPQQVGKLSLLQHCFPEMPSLSLHDPLELLSANIDPTAFLLANGSPMILAEIQNRPQLLPYIKTDAEKKATNGLYFLTGSQHFTMMQQVCKCTIGKIGILQLLGISLNERYSVPFTGPFIPSLEYIKGKKPGFTCIGKELWTIIHEGSYPAVVAGTVSASDFFGSYVKTYFEHDVRQLTEVSNEMLFLQFLTVLASKSGQMLNYSYLAKKIGISGPTAKRWVSILVATGIVYLLQPYVADVEKRTGKTPKIYFLDTGLACWLTKWKSPEDLQSGAMADSLFETFVVSEVVKSFLNSGKDNNLYFYRNKNGIEIDLLIDDGVTLYPVEIKNTELPTETALANFRILKRIKDKPIGPKVVVCPSDSISLLSENAFSLPVSYL